MKKKLINLLCRILIASIVITPFCLCGVCEPMLTEEAGDVCLAVLHLESGTIVSSERDDESRKAAGLWTVAPMLVISEGIASGELRLTDTVTVSAEAAGVRGTTAFIEGGEVITVESLFKSAAIIGAGDAVYALAEALSGGAQAFIGRLNSRLEQLSLSVRYEALSEETALTARELAVIGSELAKCEVYLTYCGTYMDTITHENESVTELVNPNKLIRLLSGARGLATGSSRGDGYCGVFYVSRGDTSFVCTVLGAETNDARFSLAKAAIENSYAGFETLILANKGQVLAQNLPVEGGLGKVVSLCAEAEVAIAVTKGSEKPTCNVNMPTDLTAPIAAGEVIATADYVDAQGAVLCSVNLVASVSVEKATFSMAMELLCKAWCGL